MPVLKYLLIVLMLLSPSLVFSQDLGMMRLSLIQGDVQVLIADNGDWSPAMINMPLGEGDRIWVPDGGRAEIQVRGGVYVRAEDQSSLDILSLNSDAMQFYLDQGHVYLNNRRGGVKTVQVDTPQSSIRSYDNSIMLIDVLEGGTNEVQVLKGYVYAENKDGKTRIASGSDLTIQEYGPAVLAPINTPDEWERWNLERDTQLVNWGESSRYLPDELHEYSSDFDRNGRWVYAADYGYVWNPVVGISAWVPYREGNWQWIHGNYVWISYEPWGWAPYHYGRWAYVSNTGWCWVPPTAINIYWGPGYVGWVNTPQYVGWVPLAPGEVYYGYGYYGPLSENITNVNRNTIVTRHYRNVTIQNSVTIVTREHFGSPTRERLMPREDLFRNRESTFIPPHERRERPAAIPHNGKTPAQDRQRERIPNVRPEGNRSTTPARTERPVIDRPVVKTPAPAQPPARIRNIRPEEIRSQRKLVKDRDASVFRPEPPKPLPFKEVKEPKVIIRKPKPEQREKKEMRDDRPGKRDR